MNTRGPALAPFVLRQRVYWEDTDASGVVYYANYLRFLERARTEWLRSLGCEQVTLEHEAGVGFVVRALTAEFLRPARLDDEISIDVWVVRIGASMVEMQQSIARGNERLVQAGVKLACVRIAAFQPVRIPRVLRELLSTADTGPNV